MSNCRVAQDGSDDYTSIRAAIDAIPTDNRERVVVYIRPGLYREKLSIDKPFVSLVGEDPATTIVSWDDHAFKLFPDGRKYGTFESYTLFAGGDDFHAEGLTIENTAGPGHAVGQAIAAYVDADRVVFRNCRILGCQDTLFTGPLPLKPIIGSSFGGPRDRAIRRYGRQYYTNCLIRGDVDFIFGSATAVFQGCEIVSNECRNPVKGYIAAASTPPESRFGHVFLDCRLTGAARQGSVYLGRPWREHAKTAFIRCRMGAHIMPVGWHNWNKPDAERTAQYVEWGSTGPGGAMDRRVAWSRLLSAPEAVVYNLAAILSGSDNWDPLRY
jgi:pectinesterase